MTRLGVLFPGQGAQHPGMGRMLWDRFACVRERFVEASDLLDRDFRHLCFDAPEDLLRETSTAQPCLYLVGYAGWQVLNQVFGERCELVVGAGHSLGEYTVLAATGAVSFADGLRLVAERGRLMGEVGTARPGTMLAILGLSIEQVERACAVARHGGGPDEVVDIGNDNAPGQVVISGTPDAVTRASAAARDLGARRVVPLATGGAFHSTVMEPVAGALRVAIDATPIKHPRCPIIANSTALPTREPDEIRAELVAQVMARVRWTESVRRISGFQVDRLVELGPGQVLTGLARRIESGMPVLSIGDGEGLDAVLNAL